MRTLTEIIALVEARQKTVNSSIEGSAILALAIHLKNIENKLSGLEAARNNGAVDAMDTEF